MYKSISHCSILYISTAQRVPQIWYCVCNLRASLNKNCKVRPIRGLQMLSEAHTIYLLHQREFVNAAIVRGILAEYRTLSQAERLPPIWYFVCNLRVCYSRNNTMWTIRGSEMLAEAPPTLLIHLRKAMKHFSSNRYLSFLHSIPSSVIIWCPKYDILCAIWESILGDLAWYGH